MFKHWISPDKKERFMGSFAGIIASIAILSTWTTANCKAQIQANPQNSAIVGTNATAPGQRGMQTNLGTALGVTNTVSPNAQSLRPVIGPQDIAPAVRPQGISPAIGAQGINPANGQQGRGLGLGQQGIISIGPQTNQPLIGPQSNQP